MHVRAAEAVDVEHLALLWYDGWQDAHAKLAPPGLVRARTHESFAARLVAALADTRATGPAGAPIGFYMLKDDELYQLYVARAARGAGVAAALIADAEARLAERGVTIA
jgi:GNAT superfamily N-acetyltransferase